MRAYYIVPSRSNQGGTERSRTADKASASPGEGEGGEKGKERGRKVGEHEG